VIFADDIQRDALETRVLHCHSEKRVCVVAISHCEGILVNHELTAFAILFCVLGGRGNGGCEIRNVMTNRRLQRRHPGFLLMR
jgi:hypothetical protein